MVNTVKCMCGESYCIKCGGGLPKKKMKVKILFGSRPILRIVKSAAQSLRRIMM